MSPFPFYQSLLSTLQLKNHSILYIQCMWEADYVLGTEKLQTNLCPDFQEAFSLLEKTNAHTDKLQYNVAIGSQNILYDRETLLTHVNKRSGGFRHGLIRDLPVVFWKVCNN